MRTNLVMNFVCADCGQLLEVDKAEHPTQRPLSSMDRPKLPTGAEMLRPDVVAVKPCAECVGSIQGHAISLRESLRFLAGLEAE